MIFNDHSDLEGSHAFLGASKWHWLNYDEDTLRERYKNLYSQALGTALHDLAKRLIKARIKLAETDRKLVIFHLVSCGIPAFTYDIEFIFPNFKAYVNDAIGFRMDPEVILFYSYNCYGTADAIHFRNNFLRIHDYKSGTTPTDIKQVLVYAGLFCLEYKDLIKFNELQIELRIYQGNQVKIHNPSQEELRWIIDKIISSDKTIKNVREAEG